MPLTYDIDAARRLVLITATGAPVPNEWFETMEAVTADARYEPGFDILYDRRNLDHTPDTMYVRAWVFRHADLMKETGDGKLAVVVDQPVVYGMIRMASAFAETAGATVNVFWNLDEALMWLGRSSESSVA
jgi:hypothetical protein